MKLLNSDFAQLRVTCSQWPPIQTLAQKVELPTTRPVCLYAGTPQAHTSSSLWAAWTWPQACKSL